MGCSENQASGVTPAQDQVTADQGGGSPGQQDDESCPGAVGGAEASIAGRSGNTLQFQVGLVGQVLQDGLQGGDVAESLGAEEQQRSRTPREMAELRTMVAIPMDKVQISVK
ncbi:hypothetical protein ABZ612_36345 [Streptomyces avermitilis]|uniref:hypothetical protein n=1 Tax=Streptomyces avermitilis TaxID=33903 RepID=UPI003403A560